MHQQPRATEHPLALNTASRSGQRSGVSGWTVSFMAQRLLLRARPRVRPPLPDHWSCARVRAAHLKLNDLSFDGIADDLQFGHGNRKLKSTRARASRIDVEHTVTLFYRRLVRMAGHNHLKPSRHGIEVQLGQVMQDVDKNFTNLKDFCL